MINPAMAAILFVILVLIFVGFLCFTAIEEDNTEYQILQTKAVEMGGKVISTGRAGHWMLHLKDGRNFLKEDFDK